MTELLNYLTVTFTKLQRTLTNTACFLFLFRTFISGIIGSKCAYRTARLGGFAPSLSSCLQNRRASGLSEFHLFFQGLNPSQHPSPPHASNLKLYSWKPSIKLIAYIPTTVTKAFTSPSHAHLPCYVTELCEGQPEHGGKHRGVWGEACPSASTGTRVSLYTLNMRIKDEITTVIPPSSDHLQPSYFSLQPNPMEESWCLLADSNRTDQTGTFLSFHNSADTGKVNSFAWICL